MQPRRRIRLVAGALVLALPLLTSCGFGKATDKVYTPGVGTNDRDGDVKVLAAVVAAAQPGSGTFIASFSNNSSKDVELSEVVGTGEWVDLTIGEIDPPIELGPGGFVNLADEGGITVTGDFEAGEVVELTFSFASGDNVTMEVPVVYACDVYEGLDTSVESGPTPDEPSEESESPEEEPTDGTTPSPSETAEASAAPSDDLYDCVPRG
jgi:hypothetical protein